jgi:hypothetical protein
MADKRGRPLLHRHLRCDRQFDPVMVCSECGEPLNPREVRTSLGPGARQAQHVPIELGAGLSDPAPTDRSSRAAAAGEPKGGSRRGALRASRQP